MVHLTSCWSPFRWYDSVRDGCVAISMYSIVASIICSAMTIRGMTGGETTWLWSPYFEANVDGSMQLVGAGVLIVLFIVIISSVLLYIGVRSNIRGLMLPWMMVTVLITVAQGQFGITLLYIYYIYLEVFFYVLCHWLLMCFHIYLFWVVKSHFIDIKRMQSPDIEVIHDY